jgi:BirA family transcriptional regulator, biotin operon repressor / biotin---[acetyl-CoA-carboxylase] ligase
VPRWSLRSSSASARPRVHRHPAPAARAGAEALLAELAGAAGGFVSGTRLAASLRVSRTAVWKHVGALRAEGYRIESVPYKGYRLASRPDALLPRELAKGLATAWLGRSLVAYERVDSTNRAAMQDLALPHGAVVYAFTQTGGRGRLGRAWMSPPGSVPFSVLLTPNLAPQRAQLLTLAAAVGLVRGIEAATGLSADIKWPNDVLCRGRKLAGILTEVRSDPDRVARAVVGIGMNVATDPAAFPEAVRARATSLAAALGRPVAAAPLFRAVLAGLEGAFDAVLGGEAAALDALMAAYRARCVTLGREVVVHAAGRASAGLLAGRAERVDDIGALWIRCADGGAVPVYAGDVTLAGEAPPPAGPGAAAAGTP